MNTADLDAITQRARAARETAGVATPGPWHYDDGITDGVTGERGKSPIIECSSVTPSVDGHRIFGLPLAEMFGAHGPDEMDADGRFIAAARAAVPALAEDAEALVAEVKRLRTVAFVLRAIVRSEHELFMAATRRGSLTSEQWHWKMDKIIERGSRARAVLAKLDRGAK